MSGIDWLFSTPQGVVALCAAGVVLAFLVAFVAERFLQKPFYQNDETWEEKEAREKREDEESGS